MAGTAALLAFALSLAPAAAQDRGSEPGKFEVRPHRGQNGELTLEQEAMARSAWQYFQNNFQPTTCLYNAVDGYPSTTMWDTASAMAALVSAMELGYITPVGFDDRMSCLLASLNKMEFYQGEIPNKAYNTITLAKVDYTNAPGEIGFSAIDMGRLLVWLAIVKERYPGHADAIDRFVLRWRFCNLVDRNGTLFGAVNAGSGVKYLQEGRLGYEEYAAAGFNMWGFHTPYASMMEPYEEIGIYGVPIAYDGRDPAKFGAHNYVVTESYMLLGIELNFDKVGDTNQNDNWHSDEDAYRLAKRVYKAQVRRWRDTGILTARSEHQLDGPPYFVYDTIYSDGQPWATIADDGTPYPQYAAVSTKAAIGMWILFDTPYTDRLAEAVGRLNDPAKGFYEGFYETSGLPIKAITANTNGIVLETLLYKKVGKLYREDPALVTLWDWVPNEEFPGNWQCLPSKPPALEP